MNIQGFLSEELWLFILLAIILALAVPEAGQAVTPYSIYALMLIMFFTSINITLDDVKRASKEKAPLMTILLMAFLVAPLIGFGFSTLLEDEVGVGLIFYSATPVAMATTFFMKKLKKDAPLALVLTAVTTLLSVVLTPVVVGLLTSLVVPINPLDLLSSLVKVVVIPFGAAVIVRHICRKKSVCSIQAWGAPLSTLAFFIVVFGVVSAAEGEIWDLGGLALVCLGLLGTLFALGYIISPRRRFELGYASAFRNGTLTMVLALEVMGPTAALPAVMITLLHNMMMVPIMFWGKKK
jgi:BASS family bile acid:Na+ symporter